MLKEENVNQKSSNETTEAKEGNSDASAKKAEVEGTEKSKEENNPEKVLDKSNSTSFTNPSKPVETENNEGTEDSASTDKSDEESDDEKILRNLLKDPKENQEKLKDDITQNVLSKIDQRNDSDRQKEVAWNGFYEENPELKGHKRLVEFESNQLVQELKSQNKDVTFKEGAKIVAKRVKSLIESIRSDNSEEVDTDSDSAAIPSSSSSTPRQGKEAQKKGGFVGELKANRQ